MPRARCCSARSDQPFHRVPRVGSPSTPFASFGPCGGRNMTNLPSLWNRPRMFCDTKM
jgi:hypothetical protein